MDVIKPKIAIFLILLGMIFLCNSCKNEVIDVMPNVSVNVVVNSGELAQLGNASAILKAGGYAGIIVYQRSSGEFFAFERLCTNYPNDTVAVVLDKGQQTATCPKCKSIFLLSGEGYKNNDGPARLPLKQYQCYYSNNRLTIVN